MDDLKERFAEADQMMGRDHWRDIADRAAEVPPPPALEWPPGLARRVAVGGVAFAVFVGAVVFAWDLSHPERQPSPAPVVDLASELPIGWSELPGPPRAFVGSAYAWTGSHLLVWGGRDDDLGGGERDTVVDDGFSFDAASSVWQAIPSGPLSPRSHVASAWTGEEFVLWGGQTADCCAGTISDLDRLLPSEMFLSDGAAYDPLTERWRELPPAPIAGRAPFSVWTGEELIVWGNRNRVVRYTDGAAYNPGTNTWRSIPDAPIELTDGTAVWTGDEMIVFGAALHGGNRPESETAIGAAYDPETDSWRELPSSIDTNPNANTAAWAGDRLIAVDYDSDAEMYHPASGRWQRLDPMPLDAGEDVPDAAAIENWLLVSFYGQVAAYSIEAGRWTDLTDELAAEAQGTLFPSGPIPAGGVIFFLDAGSEDGPRLLAYRPPVSPSAPGAVAEGHVLSEGTSNGVPWTLVTKGEVESEGVELRWNDEQSGSTSQVLEARGGLGVAWQTFGRGDPDDAVIFGVTPVGAAIVRHTPGQGLPDTQVQVIDVPGADWSAFVLTSYAAIGTVTANDANGGRSSNVLIVPRGGERVLETVEAFLAARIAGTSAETFLASGTEKVFGRSGIAPLYTGVDGAAYFRSKVLFLDPLGDGSWEVGVRLDARDGTVAEDTLGVEADGLGKPLIIGLRGGTTGP
jgi:hypothetical protein